MAEIDFNFGGVKTIMECNLNDLLKDICKNYSMKINKDLSELVFLYNGTQLKQELTFIEHANGLDKERKKMSILVQEIIDNPIEDNKQQVFCPECDENIKIKIKDYKVKLFDCKNGHKSNISFAEFKDLLSKDKSEVICDLCKNTLKLDNINNKFYFCFTCNQKCCDTCKTQHEKNKEHKTVKYILKNYLCKEHYELFNSYCEDCQKNICLNCKEKHDKHKIISYLDILPKKDEKLKELKDLKEKIDNMKLYINQIIKIYKEILKNYELLYDIQKKLIDNYNTNNLNYESLYNINEIDNSNNFKDIDEIINASTSINNIIEIYQNMDKEVNIENLKIINKSFINNDNDDKNSLENNENKIRIKYQVSSSKENKLKIFGEKFVNNNKDKCKIKYKTSWHKEIFELKETIDLKGYKEDRIEVVLTNIDKIIDMSHMFDGCKTLVALYDISDWDTSKITNMSYIFNGCESILSIPDISKWNTSNVKDMSCMFSGCNSLESIPDISKWDVSNVENMSLMFCGKDSNSWVSNTPSEIIWSTMESIWNKWTIKPSFGSYIDGTKSSLKTLPDISNWNTSKVKNINGIFSNCICLKSLPNISNWNISNVNDISYAFSGCSSLESLPDISIWDISNVTNMCSIFNNCNSLKSLPDISKWNTSNVINMSSIFSDCGNLDCIPDISNWKTCNLKNMIKIFKNCESLKSLPDLSKWDTSNITDMDHIFSGCHSLNSLPDISQWKTSNLADINNIFSYCCSLKSLPDISNWDTSKVINMESAFSFCKSLETIPDISNWDTSRVIIMEKIFYGCSSLKSLPDISNWKTFNVTNMNSFFYGCKSLVSLPDISSWNTENVTDMSYMFNTCGSLTSLPDLNKWNIKKVKKYESMFDGCSKELKIPKQFKGCLIF